MRLKLPIAAVALGLIAIGCSEQQNPRPLSPGTPNATVTPTPQPSSTAPDGTLNAPPSATTAPSQRAAPDSQR